MDAEQPDQAIIQLPKSVIEQIKEIRADNLSGHIELHFNSGRLEKWFWGMWAKVKT